MRPIAALSFAALSFFLGAACAPDLDGLFGPPACEPGYAGSPPTCQAQGGAGLGGSAPDAGPDAPAPDCHLTCQVSITGACCGCPAGCSPGIPDGMCEDGLSCSDLDGGSATSTSGTGGGKIEDAGNGGGYSGSCAHDPCAANGGPLAPDCDPCVAEVCEYVPSCCTTEWDATCAAYVDIKCGDGGTYSKCGKSGGDCSHSVCDTGAALQDGCNLCVYEICGSMLAGCCTVAWLQECVDAVSLECELPCP